VVPTIFQELHSLQQPTNALNLDLQTKIKSFSYNASDVQDVHMATNSHLIQT
jgi:hypothetical protein